jgi:hypothetical protein
MGLKQAGPDDRVILSGRTWNTVAGAVDYVRGRMAGVGGGGLGGAGDHGIILIRNDGEDDVPRFGVLGLDAPLILPDDNLLSFQAAIAFGGSTPESGTHDGKFAIVLEPCPAGRVAHALLSGVTPALVNFATDSDTHADIRDGNVETLAGGGGAAQVLWKPSGTGELWALMRLGQSTTLVKEGTLDSDLVYGGTAQMSVHTGAAGSEVDSGEGVLVSDSHLCPDESHAAGTWVTVALIAGHWKVIAAQCPCNEAGS